jgi:predicted TIM-barrel fold metal-dependent hydrolase
MATAAEIRAEVGHPIVDGDGHAIEVTPVLLDYIDHLGGAGLVDHYRMAPIKRQFAIDDRVAYWTTDSGAWVWPTRNTLDRATATLPHLYAERLDELGIDFAIVYPSEGLSAPALADDELRLVACRAYNQYIADCYRPYGDRMTPAAVIPVHTPEEAVDELRYAVTELELKVAVLRSYVRRPATQASGERLDFLALGSDYDYDPVWAACTELGVAATFHTSAIYGGRDQIPNYVYNHIGVLAAGGEAVCKALFMGGVTKRFPSLNFAFLEGGVGWAVSLYADLVSHWERRSGGRIGDFDPDNLDRELFFKLIQDYGDRLVLAHMADIRPTFGRRQPRVEAPDNFSAVPMANSQEMLDLFVAPFWFGCEADDPVTAHAFDRRVNPFGAALNALLGTDNGHWDVPDMTQVVPEAWELVERELISRDDFRQFVFANPVRLHAEMNRRFFQGTRIEQDVDRLLGVPG